MSLSTHVANDILRKLDHFEKQRLYLSGNTNLYNLAKALRTNSTYLSQVVNHYKESNFANYINKLRVEYAIHQWLNDSRYRMYSIKAIACEAGFNTPSSFSRAFMRETGFLPSSFLRRIEGSIPS